MDQPASEVALPGDVERVLQELQPVAVLLHGSRAIGGERPDSDWDVCVLVDDVSEPRWLTERVGDVSLDIDIIPATAPDSVMTDLFGTSLRFARVLSDSRDGVGASFVARARDLHTRGRRVPVQRLVEQAAHAQRVARRMAASAGQPDLFLLHLGTFFGLAVRYWFDWQGRWPEPPYEALQSIRAGDPDYASLLSKLASDASAGSKAQAAEEISSRLVVRA